MTVDDVAARGFGSAGEAYERGRPSYPPEAVACLVEELSIGSGAVVVEVAAGTGKMSRLLVPSGAQVVAVEPVAGMRRVLIDQVPGVDVVAGTAEALPLASGSADAVIVAQAFHWFRVSEALAEIARVLRPDGGLGLVWNEWDRSLPWVAEVYRRMQRRRPQGIRQYGDGFDWSGAVRASSAFTPLLRRHVVHEHEHVPETFLAAVLSTSFISALAAEEQAALANEVRAVLGDLGGTFQLPYRTDVFWCRRL